MSKTRPAALAGTFYPADPRALRDEVGACLDAAPEHPGAPEAVIAPHAGYMYSGVVAGRAYHAWRGLAGIERVILAGPCHRKPVRGLALSGADAFETPLGSVAVDVPARERLLSEFGPEHLRIDDEAHAHEHSLEVQLPFIQTIFPGAKILPLGVGRGGPDIFRAVLELFQDDATRVVVSSDLSHFHAFDEARRRDRRTSDHIEAGRGAEIGYEDACGRDAVAGLLQYAAGRGLRALTVDLRNSGDTAGRKDRVVGYGAYHLTARAEPA